MKLHELKPGTRFCFAGNDIPYTVVHKSSDAIHFIGLVAEPTFIVSKEHEKSWNADVEMA